MRLVRVVAALLTAVLLTGAAARADAATFLVNSNADTTDGACSTEPAGCTLREAIEAVVATPGRDTIRFDPSVFPKGELSQSILLTSPLPVIADPAGTVVDGAGTSFFLTGGNNDVAYGLVFASAPGVPLTKVTVANLLVASFKGPIIHVCGGEFPACDGDVSDTLIDRVVTNYTTDAGEGIRVAGRTITKTRIVDSVSFQAGGAGIRLDAQASVVGWRIQNCTVRRATQLAIDVRAVGDVIGGAILDTAAVANGGGITVAAGGRVAKAKIANVVSSTNMTNGIYVRGTAGTSGVAITDTMSTGNIAGITLEFAQSSVGPTISNVVLDTNFGYGALLLGETSKAKIQRVRALANGGVGLDLSENALGASLKDVLTAGNAFHGLTLRGNASALQKIRADGNGQSGILLTALLNGLSGTSSGNSVQKNVANANDEHGIAVDAATTDSRLQKNVALGNGDDDLRDGNPSCDANVWSANTFTSANDPCIQ